MVESKTLLGLTLVFSVAASTAQAQMSFAVDLNAYPKIYNPVPLRHTIPTSLVKIHPRQQIIVITPAPVKVASSLAANSGTQASATVSSAATYGATGSVPAEKPQLVLSPRPSAFNNRIYVSPKALVLPPVKISQVAAKKNVFDPVREAAPQPVQPLPVVQAPKILNYQVQLSPMIDISPDEYKMIQALLLLEYQKKYDMALSLLADIVNSNSKFKMQATYHYALLALRFELKDEFKTRMFQVMKNADDAGLRRKAIESLVANAYAIQPEDTTTKDSEMARIQIMSLQAITTICARVNCRS